MRSGDTYTTSTSSSFYYASGARTSSYAPTYDCTETTDAFSVDNPGAKLTYPIALMTADEIMRAGGKLGTSLSSPYAWYYLNSANGSITGTSKTYWWLLSPHIWGWDNFVDCVHGEYIPAPSADPIKGDLNDAPVAEGHRVRPVVSLKSCVKYSNGDGSASDPYTIKETTSGC